MINPLVFITALVVVPVVAAYIEWRRKELGHILVRRWLARRADAWAAAQQKMAETVMRALKQEDEEDSHYVRLPSEQEYRTWLERWQRFDNDILEALEERVEVNHD